MNDGATIEPPGRTEGAFAADNGAAWAVLAAASRNKADAFLEKQGGLVDLQAQELAHELKLRHWSLRVRHISDVIKLAFEIAIAFIVFAVAVGLGAAIWSASKADGLVIRSFDVPQSMAVHGLTGQVVANKLLDRLMLIQNATRSARAPSTFANDWTSDIKVEIPDTGISLGEALRYLRSALGHEKHLSGEVYDTPAAIALTLRLDAEPGRTFDGKAGDLDAMVARAAEAVFREMQPYRYSIYLAGESRFRESFANLLTDAKSANADERAWAYNGLAIHYELQDDYDQSRLYAERALAENPLLPNPMSVAASNEFRRGHDEGALAAERRAISLFRGAGARELDPATVEPSLRFHEIRAAEITGDYRLALEERRLLTPVPGLIGAAGIAAGAAIESVRAHDPRGARETLAELTPAELEPDHGGSSYLPVADYAQGLAAGAQSDWHAAIRWFERSEAAAQASMLASTGHFSDRDVRVVLDGPWLAYAYARAGDRAHADAVIATLAPDCDICTRMRGRIAVLRGNRGAAAYWFAKVEARSPSIPFADTDWGEMLLHKADYDGAIAKFASAHEKGPHFADPLEMWGEALMQKNRSDLAVVKFEEADKYAPNWGRLHLEWGNALIYLGKQADAQGQFAIASHLDLSAADAAALARSRAPHV